MNSQCLNSIITDNLAISIDLNDLKSWDLNPELTSISMSKWAEAKSTDAYLFDFGLTGFDNGMTDEMYSGLTITSNDIHLKLHRVGYNDVHNPTTGETTGSTVVTQYTEYPMSAVTSTVGKYFELNGGYLQGFFKLHGYDYELLPSRFNNGITIETLINITPNSQGIFYMMGVRSEDKYNEYFSGETSSGLTQTNEHVYGGVNTSDTKNLESIKRTTVNRKAFRNPEEKNETKYGTYSQIDNIGNNVIAFEITSDKRIGYKYIDENGILIFNSSPKTISSTNWTIVTITFTPNNIIKGVDINCAPRRTGKLTFYINGRSHWSIMDFPEFYFREINTDKNLQIGVPYSISWGGGSFGLKHSWHYDFQSYSLYTNQDTDYLLENFVVESTPFPTICSPYSGGTSLDGILFSVNETDFDIADVCNPTIGLPKPVIEIMYTGETTTTGRTYFFKYDKPITVLSNRDYEIDLSIFNDGFFSTHNSNGILAENKISIVVYGTTDVDIIDEIEYVYPLNGNETSDLISMGLSPFPDKQQYQYLKNGMIYYGENGVPIVDEYSFLYGNSIITPTLLQFSSGELSWKPISCKFRLKENSGKQIVNIGILIETNYGFNINRPLYFTDIIYSGADILTQDERKNELTIEKHFNDSYIGGIQKLRIYDKSLTSHEVLHNAMFERSINREIGVLIGGRIIGNLESVVPSNLQWVTGYMFNATLLYNYKIWTNGIYVPVSNLQWVNGYMYNNTSLYNNKIWNNE